MKSSYFIDPVKSANCEAWTSLDRTQYVLISCDKTFRSDVVALERRREWPEDVKNESKQKENE